MKRTQTETVINELVGAQRVLWHAALLTGVSNLLFAVLAVRVGASGLITAGIVAHAAVAFGVLAAAAVHRTRSSRWINVADAVLFSPYFFTIWISHGFLAEATYDPLFASKLLAVGIAAIVPCSFRLHLALMAGLVVQAAAIWLRLAREAAPLSAEPWVTGLFFLVAGWFLVARRQQTDFEKELQDLRVKTRALTHVAQAFVAVRHLAHTPLQKVDLLTALLRQGAPVTPERLDILEHAVNELEMLLDEFRRYEDVVEQSAEEISIDAYAKLARMRPPG